MDQIFFLTSGRDIICYMQMLLCTSIVVFDAISNRKGVS